MRSGLAERTLVLHVGIHKTASTYIQHRLKGNQAFLKRHGLLYPRRRRDHLDLVHALRQGDLQPWLDLIGLASRQGLRPLISAEVLSVILHQPAEEGTTRSLLSRLQDQLQAFGIRTFQQIAAWTDDDVEAFSELLSFKDRAKRDQWVKQAQELIAEGGQWVVRHERYDLGYISNL
jgi:hypothetical protein